MFGKSKNNQPAPAPAPEPVDQRDPEGKKGRPTPKRKDAEAANFRPLVITDRKAARKQESQKLREQRALEQQAMNTGDDRYMPAQHRGPERAFARQFVDARYNLGELMMPVLLVLVIGTLIAQAVTQSTAIMLYLTIAMYGFILVMVVDMVFLRRALKKAATTKFGDFPRGLGAYAIMRASQFRRLRLPKVLTKRGDYPK
ncbi:DUF3043 domain-containing protein [Micrococcales bacterium 31B]|nr:DUF3043 domain-containing protein [Micrococcales bacterium 31B]